MLFGRIWSQQLPGLVPGRPRFQTGDDAFRIRPGDEGGDPGHLGVVDENGGGIPGALVAWSNTDISLDESAFRVFNPFSDYGRMSEKTTDGQGRYRMTVPAGAGCVVAEKPGLRVGTKCHVDVQIGHETSGVDVVLRAGTASRPGCAGGSLDGKFGGTR